MVQSFCLYESQFLFPLQNPTNRLGKAIVIDAAGKNGIQHSFVLHSVFGTAQQIIACQHRQYGGFSGSVCIRNGSHHQIISDDDTLKVHFLPQILMYSRG